MFLHWVVICPVYIKAQLQPSLSPGQKKQKKQTCKGRKNSPINHCLYDFRNWGQTIDPHQLSKFRLLYEISTAFPTSTAWQLECNLLKRVHKAVVWWGSEHQSRTLTNLRSMMSCSMNRIRDDVFLSLTIFSIWLKYWSMRGCKTTKQEGEIRTGLFLREESHIYSSQSTGLFSCIARSSSCHGCARLNWQPPGFAFYVSLDLHSEKWHPVKSRGQNGSFQNALSRI